MATLGLVAGTVAPADAQSAPPSSASSRGEGVVAVERGEEELLVLELRLGTLSLHDGLVGYLHPDGVLLPLQQVADAVGFSLLVRPSTGTVEGWFLDEDRRFSLDWNRGEVRVAGRPAAFDRNLIEPHQDDLYVSHTLLSRWFPVGFEVDLTRLLVLLHPREKLPIQERRERRKKWSRHGRLRTSDEPVYPPLDDPFRLWDWPVLDSTLSYSLRPETPGLDAQEVRYNALLVGDFLYMNTELSLSLGEGRDSRKLCPEVRLKAGRKDPGRGLLGPLRASEYTLGHAFTPERSLVSLGRCALGVEISNFPLARPHEFDRITLRGHALPGWEVELYQNEDLVDFQAVGAGNLYEFNDVPLLYGFNVFRLVFYGPQGERREKVRRVLVGPGQQQSGASYYRAALYRDDSRSHGDLLSSVQGDGEGSVGGAAGRLFLEYEHGLSRRLSLTGNLHSLPLGDGRHTYTSLGLRATRSGYYASLDTVLDSEGGWAGRFSGQTRLGGVQLRLDHEQFSDFVSETLQDVNDPLTSRDSFRVEGRLGRGRGSALAVRWGVQHESRRSGRMRDGLFQRWSLRFRKLSLANTLGFQISRGGGSARERRVNGSVVVSRRSSRLALRGGLRHEVDSHRRVTELSLTADVRHHGNLSTRLQLRHDAAGSTGSVYGATTNWRREDSALGLSATYRERSGLHGQLTYSFSLGRNPVSKRWRSWARSMSRGGAVAARVFLDHNQNGHWDAGDESLPGVQFTTSLGGRTLPTDSEGVAWITQLPPYRHSDLELALHSLEDPYWVPTREGVGIEARPGRAVALDFPVVMSGEVDGTVYLDESPVPRPVSNVNLQLLDSEGRVVVETKTVFDGFYLLERVVPGRYRLRVDPDQMKRLGLASPAVREIVIKSDGTVLTGVDFVLEAVPPTAS